MSNMISVIFNSREGRPIQLWQQQEWPFVPFEDVLRFGGRFVASFRTNGQGRTQVWLGKITVSRPSGEYSYLLVAGLARVRCVRQIEIETTGDICGTYSIPTVITIESRQQTVSSLSYVGWKWRERSLHGQECWGQKTREWVGSAHRFWQTVTEGILVTSQCVTNDTTLLIPYNWVNYWGSTSRCDHRDMLPTNRGNPTFRGVGGKLWLHCRLHSKAAPSRKF